MPKELEYDVPPFLNMTHSQRDRYLPLITYSQADMNKDRDRQPSPDQNPEDRPRPDEDLHTYVSRQLKIVSGNINKEMADNPEEQVPTPPEDEIAAGYRRREEDQFPDEPIAMPKAAGAEGQDFYYPQRTTEAPESPDQPRSGLAGTMPTVRLGSARTRVGERTIGVERERAVKGPIVGPRRGEAPPVERSFWDTGLGKGVQWLMATTIAGGATVLGILGFQALTKDTRAGEQPTGGSANFPTHEVIEEETERPTASRTPSPTASPTATTQPPTATSSPTATSTETPPPIIETGGEIINISDSWEREGVKVQMGSEVTPDELAYWQEHRSDLGAPIVAPEVDDSSEGALSEWIKHTAGRHNIQGPVEFTTISPTGERTTHTVNPLDITLSYSIGPGLETFDVYDVEGSWDRLEESGWHPVIGGREDHIAISMAFKPEFRPDGSVIFHILSYSGSGGEYDREHHSYNTIIALESFFIMLEAGEELDNLDLMAQLDTRVAMSIFSGMNGESWVLFSALQ